MGSIRRKAHILPQNAHSIGQYSSGAMEEMRQKVQNASTHMLRCQNHDCACNRRSVQGAVQRGDGGSAVEGSKCQHSQTTMQKSRAHAQQLVSSWASSMGRWNVMHGFDIRRKAHELPQNAHSKSQHSIGGWMKCQGRFKMQALTFCDAKVMNTHKQPVSSSASSRGRWNVTHGFDSRGTGGNVAEGSKGEHSAQKQILL